MQKDHASSQEPDASVHRIGADFITEDALAAVLRTKVLGRAVVALGECESTMAFARRLLETAGESGKKRPRNGTLVTADFQSGGRGRNGKTWVAERGSSLLLSLILYPAVGREANSAAPTQTVPSKPNLLTMGAALAVVRALRNVGAENCSIKWPNDVLDPDGRKLCGILTESVEARDGSGVSALVTGVGMNVNQAAGDFPKDLRERASSARIVAGRPVSRLDLLKSFLEEFENCLGLEDEVLFRDWARNCSTLGARVRVRLTGREIEGRALGVENDGGLEVRLDSGVSEIVRSGDVETLRVKRKEKDEG